MLLRIHKRMQSANWLMWLLSMPQHARRTCKVFSCHKTPPHTDPKRCACLCACVQSNISKCSGSVVPYTHVLQRQARSSIMPQTSSSHHFIAMSGFRMTRVRPIGDKCSRHAPACSTEQYLKGKKNTPTYQTLEKEIK